MSIAPGPLTAVRWTTLFPSLLLVRAARVSLMIRVILLALAGLLLTELGWSLVDRVVLDAPANTAPLSRLTALPPTWLPGGGVEISANEGLAIQATTYGGPLVRAWHWATQPFLRLTDAGGFRRWFGLLLEGLWAIAVWAIFGGAIARIAALHLAYGETIGPVTALRAAIARWLSTAGAPALTLVALFVMALPLMLAGLLVRLNIFALLLGLIWIVLILGGVVIAIVAVGLALGWPLMWSTVAVERTDAFDGISRAYAYVYQRPLHALAYVVLAGLLGLLAQTAVNVIVDTSLGATKWAVSSGAGEERTADLYDRAFPPRENSIGGPTEVAAKMVRFWHRLFASLAAAYPLAYLFSAAVGIYLLLRRHIDSTELTEITFDEGDPQRGLPPLAADPVTGVPHIAGQPPRAATGPSDPSAPPAP